MDCDTLVLRSIKELFIMDLQGKPIAMASDCLQNSYKKYIAIPLEQSYYNSGVMVIDLKKWRENRCLERIMHHLKNVRNKYPLVDQDLINVVLNQDIVLMDMKYNYLSQYWLYDYKGIQSVYDLKTPYFWEYDQWIYPDQAVILHFCGQTFGRPWYKNSKHPGKKIYDSYYKKSPWKDIEQQKCNQPFHYKIQYFMWRYMPKKIQVVGGRIMQRVFIKITYKV